MTVTILSAKYGNPENTSAVVQTVERGAKAVSQDDTPSHWATLMAWQAAGNTIDPVDPPPTDDELDEVEAQQFQQVGSKERAILQAFFEHENRLRVLEADSSVTIGQVYNWFKAKMRGA